MEINTPPQTGSVFTIAGFWRRYVAFLLDALVIVVPLTILGFAFEDVAFTWGPYGRIPAFALIFAYWVYFNSRLGQGQTVGKRVMKIAVVDNSGASISVKKALLRSGFITLIFFFSRWALPLNPVLQFLGTALVFGGGLAVFYGLLFNGKSRQGFHDLLSQSYVVKVPVNGAGAAPKASKTHKKVMGVLFFSGFIFAVVNLISPSANWLFGLLEVTPVEVQELQTLGATLKDESQFFSVKVTFQKNHKIDTGVTTKNLSVVAWAKQSCRINPESCQASLKQIARTVLGNYSRIDEAIDLKVSVINRFDFGFTSGSVSVNAAQSISEWRQEL
jgi:uncharacterized RDD family membrane protein YckC